MARSKGYDHPGQPAKWKSKQELQEKIDAYFIYCEDNKRPYTIAGIASFLDVSRQTIYNYSYKEEFFDIIKKARDKIMAYIEEEAIIRGNAGTIFVMKNYGYTDKQEVSIESNDELQPSFRDSLKRAKDETGNK